MQQFKEVIPPNMLNKKYKAFFFDAGNTLFHVYPSVGAVYANVARSYQFNVDASLIDEQFGDHWQAWSHSHPFPVGQALDQEKAWWYGLVSKIMLVFGKFEKFNQFFDEVYLLFSQPQVWRIFPEVSKVLAECQKRGIILGIVSNWDSRLVDVCHALGVAGQFDFIISSAQAGVAKPDPAIFQLALKKAGVVSTEALHIGDSWLEDIQGATAAQLDSLWIRRHGHDESSEQVAMTTTLETLLTLC